MAKAPKSTAKRSRRSVASARKAKPQVGPKCKHCDAKARARGVCKQHYFQAHHLVRAGKTTWKKLEAAGKVDPLPDNPFRDSAK